MGRVVEDELNALGSHYFGNGQTYARSYDQAARVNSYTLAGASYAVLYDDASRVSAITETLNPPNSNTYGYDTLDRLTSASLPGTTYGYSYDAVGNRLTRTAGAGTDTYTYGTTSNRIATLTPSSGPARSFTLDSNGSTTADGLNTYGYDVRGRMVSATSSLGTTTYTVNALGQRTRKTNSFGDTVFHYDLQGHLIAESTATGTTLREYVWLGDTPIALLTSAGRHYIHADHLNTPRLVANQTPATVWRWDQFEPFGVNAANDSPSGLGAFEQPLRFPGQYVDKETNLHYNYFRDYDPGIGRYPQSDPIGLRGGLNTYAYVSSSPTSYADPLGLINFIAGGGGALIPVYGGEVSGGGFVNPGWFGQQAGGGAFVSGGQGVGFNIGAEAFVGGIVGGMENIPGQTTNITIGVGPYGLTIMLQPNTYDFIGGYLSYGPSYTAVSGSITNSVTKIILGGPKPKSSSAICQP